MHYVCERHAECACYFGHEVPRRPFQQLSAMLLRQRTRGSDSFVSFSKSNMNWFALASIIITLAAIFGFINVRFLKLPNTIGLMVVAIVFTLVLFASSVFDDRILESARRLIGYVDFQEVLLEVMLGFLLFAGALHTNFDQLKVQRWPVL